MPTDLSVPRVGAPPAVAGDSRPAAPPPRSPVAAPPGTPMPNPSLRLDPALSMVVIEFRDDSGAVRASIPSQQQLDAYRAWERSNTGPPQRAGDAGAPPGGGVGVPPAPAAIPADSSPQAETRSAVNGMETSAD